MSSYRAVLRSYAADAERRKAEDDWWSDPSLSLSKAIRRASLSEIPSRGRLVRFSHQCRLAREVLVETAEALAALEREIARSNSFDDLYALVSNVCSTIYGAGDLYAYDVAQRIGLRLGLHPEKIYLHTGTRVGARALGIDVAGRNSIRIDELPPPLRALSPAEAEDVLCIYKSYFGNPDEEDTVPEVRGCSPRMGRSSRC
jgi:hypothetical protein